MTRGEQKTPHQNRIVRRTRVAVKNALMELIHEKNYPRISVQEIAEKADVGRSTLYSKADILVKI
ncbi:MAG: TetR/AcrR family transcriptional regulator [Desulfobacterales bacterium]|nr:TetR/AcrR family transcriptional regulator [Desulfobacterales bacterium]